MGARGTIAAIKPHSTRRKHYQIVVDGHDNMVVHEDVIVACTISVGDRLTDDLLSRIEKEKRIKEAMDAAMHHLDYRARTRHELQQTLEEKDFKTDIIQKTIAKLEKSGLIDDRSFARDRTRSLLKRNYGSKRIIYRLRQQHGVDERLAREVVGEELQGLDETERAMQALEKKLDKWQDMAPQKRRARAYRHLARLGYDEDTISNTLAKLLPDEWGL